MKSKDKILLELIEDANWSIRYHNTKINEMSKEVRDDGFSYGYHIENKRKSEVLLMQLQK